MCAIIGSFDRSMYDVLFEANNARGNFAYSHCFINPKSETPHHIKKFKKIPNINDIPDVKSNVYHFGHFQAPTSSVRKWKEETSHPFEHNDWVVAHNGVLTNFEQLCKEYAPEQNIKVDSALIPLMLSHHTFEMDAKQKDEAMIENAVKTVLEKIKGTFALWIINRKHKRAFVARQGSTLFANASTGSFCSVESKSEGWSELSEGYIYEVLFKAKCLAPFAKFSIDSPFLFIQE
jgi:glutamine phosphoribosylpyrophosphate amidotransferase